LTSAKELVVEARDTHGASSDPVQTEVDPLSLDGSVAKERPCILLVDDDALMRDAMGSMLHFLGSDPVLAASGEEALAALASGLRPALVILDMDMPGLGGAATLPRLRDLLPTLPVLIATGRVDETVWQLIRCHPLVGLMPKPFHLGDLRRHLSELLCSWPAAAG
jgi:CheY-like chemotaxis protein